MVRFIECAIQGVFGHTPRAAYVARMLAQKALRPAWRCTGGGFRSVAWLSPQIRESFHRHILGTLGDEIGVSSVMPSMAGEFFREDNEVSAASRTDGILAPGKIVILIKTFNQRNQDLSLRKYNSVPAKNPELALR